MTEQTMKPLAGRKGLSLLGMAMPAFPEKCIGGLVGLGKTGRGAGIYAIGSPKRPNTYD